MNLPALTAQLFYQYDFCPHWIWFDRYGDPRKKDEMNELMEKLLEQGVAHEKDFIRDKKITEVATTNLEEGAAQTRELMRQGADVIYQGVLMGTIDGRAWVGRPDLLVRRKRRPLLGRYVYEPVDIKSGKDLKSIHKYQLTLYALLLQQMQGVLPKHSGIININHEQLFFEPREFLEKFTARRGEIERIIDGQKPPLLLTRSCLQGPWGKQCIAQAEEANDISLLYNVDRRCLETLRAHGVRTVSDAAHMDITILPKIPYMGLDKLARMRLQAASLVHHDIRVLHAPQIPEEGLLIHFDIEGDPLLDVEYLFGFLMEGATDDRYTYFIAEQPEQEEQMWRAFLAWLETLPNTYTVYHYAAYEKSRLTMLEAKYGGSPALEIFKSRLFDLFAVVTKCLVFPLYFYSIKDICKHLGFRWRHKKAGGAQSIFWYETWLASGDREVLHDIIRYNEDDVRASVFLKNWLKSQSTVPTTETYETHHELPA